MITSPRSMIPFKYVGNNEVACGDHNIYVDTYTLIRTSLELRVPDLG